MPKVNPRHGSQVEKLPGFEGHYEELDGYMVVHERHADGGDFGPLFKGLPDDRCQSPHWGIVLSGRVTMRYADGTEDVVEAGEAYYARPGHLPVIGPDTELIEFSPAAEFRRTVDTVKANIAAAGAQG